MDPATAAANPVADGRSLPLLNLSMLRSRMDNVQRFLSDSLNSNTIIADAQMEIVSKEITATINEVIANGTALISCSGFRSSNSQIHNPSFSPTNLTESDLNFSNSKDEIDLGFLKTMVQIPNPSFPPTNLTESDLNFSNSKDETDSGFLKTEVLDEETRDDLGIVELDAVELLAEHLHFCDFCGKGFKRDANLRMHMRAHGNKFKTLEALSKPEKSVTDSGDLDRVRTTTTRFSCPFTGCSRNKHHKKFRPLKSVICVKNHFKRSHCPKMYSCNRCHKKNFSVLADLKSHLKHCGETKWKCSCGTSFSRKDKLFGHIALFEGHMPAMAVAAEEVAVPPPPVVEKVGDVKGVEWVNNDVFFDGLSPIDDFCLQDLLGDDYMDWNL